MTQQSFWSGQTRNFPKVLSPQRPFLIGKLVKPNNFFKETNAEVVHHVGNIYHAGIAHTILQCSAVACPRRCPFKTTCS